MKFTLRLATMMVGATLALPMFAQPIALAIVGNTQVSATDILFNTSYDGTGTYAPAGSPGQFQVNSPVTDVFAANGITPMELGNIMSLSSTTTPTGSPIVPPMLFMTFNGAGSNLDLYLTEIEQGTFAPGSPFNFTSDAAGNAVADFGVMGELVNTSTFQQTLFTGTFSATFNGTTVAELQNPANLPKDTSYSATFSLTFVPEPASLLLVGAGLLGAGLIARKKSKA